MALNSASRTTLNRLLTVPRLPTWLSSRVREPVATKILNYNLAWIWIVVSRSLQFRREVIESYGRRESDGS